MAEKGTGARPRSVLGRLVRASLAIGLVASLVGLGVYARRFGARPAAAEPLAAAPKVTIAAPIVKQITEWTEQTGRAEAADTVDVRARAAGHLQRVAFREGDQIQKGDLLFVIDPRPYRVARARAQAEVLRARVDLELGKKEAGRAEKLFQSNVIAEREVDAQRSSLEQLGARMQVAKAGLASASLDVDYAFVRAPISGRIGRMLVTPGNLVGPELPTPLATIVSIDPLYIYVDVNEVHALQLTRNSSDAGLARVGFADETGYPHEGKIDFIDNRVDPQTGTLKLRVVVKNADGKLRPGLFARVRLAERGSRDAILVSDRAIATDQDRKFVWVVGADGKAEYRAVKLGPLHEGLRIVREGLRASDRIVIRGLQRVRPGTQVAAETVAMTTADEAVR
jgi:RND family efflux transporter MFP subunit